MRAIQVSKTGGPEVLEINDVPSPTPGPGELLVDVEAIGVNFIDIYRREGLYPGQLPFIPGSEVAGVVRAVGDGVAGVFPGDRVVSSEAKGGYAEQTLIPVERAVKLPAGVASKEAAAIWLQGLTAHYLSASTFPLQPGQVALVHAAAGGVGLLLCQLAKRRGAFVIGTASTEEKRALARGAGADEMIDYTSQDFAAEARRITKGIGVDVVYDSVGKTTFDKSLDALRKRGTLVLFGQSSGPVPPIDLQTLNRKGSLFVTRPTLGDYVATREELTERATELLVWLARDDLEVRVGAEFPLAQAGEAHRAIASRSTTGKVLLIP